MKVLVTGAAGFIGFHTCVRLLERGDLVIGVDNLNDYYDVDLKKARLAQLDRSESFKFVRLELGNDADVAKLFASEQTQRVIHLAAQAGVRYASENPHAYVRSNLSGTLNILEGCRHNGVEHLVYASSSSVYGANSAMPFSVSQNVDHPLSFYGATKKSNELMAHSYAHLYGIPVTGLRFFTVYGPWGRPDMALFKFTRNILADEPIDIYNYGDHERDFTYIDDIVEGVILTSDQIAKPNKDWKSDVPDPATSTAPYRLYNIGNNKPVELMSLIKCVEVELGKTAKKNFLPMQPGDVRKTYADIDALQAATGFRPQMPIDEGVRRFIAWYRDYYKA